MWEWDTERGYPQVFTKSCCEVMDRFRLGMLQHCNLSINPFQCDSIGGNVTMHRYVARNRKCISWYTKKARASEIILDQHVSRVCIKSQRDAAHFANGDNRPLGIPRSSRNLRQRWATGIADHLSGALSANRETPRCPSHPPYSAWFVISNASYSPLVPQYPPFSWLTFFPQPFCWRYFETCD